MREKDLSTQLTARGTALVAADEEIPIRVSTSYLAVLVVSSILLLAHLPMLITLARELWRREHYQFFPFLPLASLFLGYVGLKRLSAPVRAGNQILSLIVLFFAAMVLIASSIVGSGTLAAFATLMTLSAAIYGVGGWILYKALLPALIILLPAIPPPFKSDDLIISKMQIWVAWVNGKVLDLMGVLHYRDGVAIHIPGHSLGVEEQCSGIHSFFALMTLTLFLILLYRRVGDSGHRPPSLSGQRVGWLRRFGRFLLGLLHPVVLLAFAVYWVLFANFLRILICVISQYYFNYNLATYDEGPHIGEPTTLHMVLSMSMFALAGFLVFSTDRLLLFFSSRSERKAEEVIPQTAPWSKSPLEMVPDLNHTWLASWTIGILFAFVATAEFWVVGNDLVSSFNRPDLRIDMLGESTLKSEYGKAQQIPNSFRVETRPVANINGEFSQSWRYLFNSTHLSNVSLDYTFTGWHELTQCYRNGDWTMKGYQIEPSRKDPNESFVIAEFTKNLHGQPHRGFLMFSLFDENGTRIAPPQNRSEKLLKERWDAIVNRVTGKSSNRATAPTYQVQIFIDTLAGLSPEERTSAIDFFGMVEDDIATAVRSKLAEKPRDQWKPKEQMKEEFKKAMKTPDAAESEKP